MRNYKLKKMSKFKWLWIRIWGSYFKIVSPFSLSKDYYLYHHKFYDIDEWNKYFKRRSEI
jgi:hypothetical protein